MDQELFDDEKGLGYEIRQFAGKEPKRFRAGRCCILVFLYSMQGQGFGEHKGDLFVCSETLHADLPALSHSQAR